ncbi:hypothetical protein DL89DRAFT_320121 [Linderina pennispora]|uniref:Uncharacterized protein n=1 Tax=Linderina pennispora TaxID=61395 RepID=A0A1Y1WM56_9FUNG|nr:uncharacterized protein DL89DRAFT_320121 [Linderina pennispora]ORX74647.1 hypothetical protein DL89DRAFT_320121 [Linderina pennispora]
MGNTGGDKTYLVGAEGREQIKRMMSLGKPKQVILDFGNDNGLDIPASESIYGLLDSLGHKRRDIHTAVLDSVVCAAMSRIQGERLPLDQHLALLAKVKRYFAVPQLQKIPLMLLAKWPDNVPDDYREAIRGSMQLYEACSLDVRRTLWRKDLPLFQQHIRPLLAKYVADAQLRSMSQEIYGIKVQEYSRKRRQHPLFIKTQDPALGTLRLDLAMVMHDSDVSVIIESDVCHGLAWSLDACIMRQTMDPRRVLELQSSPYSRHILAQCVLNILEDIAPNSEASSKYRDLTWPSLILTIGLSAGSLLVQDRPKIPAINRNVRARFYPSLISFIKESIKFDRAVGVHDDDAYGGGVKRARRDSAGAYSGRSGTAVVAVTEESGLRPSQDDVMVLNSSELARQVLYAYLLKRVAAGDLGMLNVWLPYIGKGLPEFLGLPEGTIKDPLKAGSCEGHASGANPPQAAIPVENEIPAFEIDAFIQSLVSSICSNKGVSATLLNTIANCLDQQTQQKNIDSIDIPLLNLLDAVGQVRHTAHEQAIVLLTEFEGVLAAEYSNTMLAHRASAGYATADAGRFAERVASHYVVDPSRLENLKKEYAQLETASPQQAFKYRICAANCLNCSKFL